MAEATTILTKLALIREIQEDNSGVTLHFQQGGQGRLARGDVNYEFHMRLARRSQERQHPVGVRFGESQTIIELIRADNDVPTEIRDENADGIWVLFQGHDGVFHLQVDHPEFARLRAPLERAIRQTTRIWFLAQKRDLVLLDILPVGESMPNAHTGNGVNTHPAANNA